MVIGSSIGDLRSWGASARHARPGDMQHCLCVGLPPRSIDRWVREERRKRREYYHMSVRQGVICLIAATPRHITGVGVVSTAFAWNRLEQLYNRRFTSVREAW